MNPVESINVIAKTCNQEQIVLLTLNKKPEIVFIDTSLPNLDTLKILESIREESPDTKVLLLLHTLDEELIINSIILGAWGYLKPKASADEFLRAIRAINDGEIWAERKIITKVLTQFQHLLSSKKIKPIIKSTLTKREEEIVEFVKLGYSNKGIAKELCISESTVKRHLVNIFKKLDISNRVQLVNGSINLSVFASTSTT